MSSILLFGILGIAFIVIGVVIVSFNKNIVEFTINHYETKCPPIPENKPCLLNFTVPHTMNTPVFLFYSLDNFYQNHRRYMKSKSSTQLAGKIICFKIVFKIS